MVVKIVYDELVNLLGEKNNDVNLNAVPPVPMMLVGLQGSGKTTTTAKLARYLENTKKKKVMMVSLDIYRPAAQEQLKSLGEQNNILTLPIIEGQQPADICQRAISAANLRGKISQKFAEKAAKSCVVIDNSSYYRMDPDVPLIVPQVNPEYMKKIKKNIIANPNCSTAQLVIALKPLHDLFVIKRVVVSTYQSVSGGGKAQMD